MENLKKIKKKIGGGVLKKKKMDYETLGAIQAAYTLLGNVLQKNKKRSVSPPPARRRRSRSRSASRPIRRRSRSRSRSRRPPSPAKRSRSRSSPKQETLPVVTTTALSPGEVTLPHIVMFYHDGKYNVPDFNDFFSEFGTVVDCKAWFWKDQKKYCGKVTFATHEDAQNCLKSKQKMIVKYGLTDFRLILNNNNRN
jgi:hypothetical protein